MGEVKVKYYLNNDKNKATPYKSALEKVACNKSVNSDMMLIDILRDSRRNIYASHSSDYYKRTPVFGHKAADEL